MTLRTQYLPTVVMLDEINSFEKDISTNVIYNTTASGVVDVFTELSLYDPSNPDLVDLETEVAYLGLNNALIDTITDVRASLLYDVAIDLPIYLTLSPINGTTKDSFKVALWLSNGKHQKVEDSQVTFRVNVGSIPTTYDTEVEMYISGTKFYSYETDLYCSSIIVSEIDVDIAQATGRIGSLYTDLISCNMAISNNLNTSIYSTAMGVAPKAFTGYCCSYSGISYSGVDYLGETVCSTTYSGMLSCSTYSSCVYEGLDYCISNCSGTSYSGTTFDALGYYVATYSGTTYSGTTYFDTTCSGTTYSGTTYTDLNYCITNYPPGIRSDLETAKGSLAATTADIFSTKLGISGNIYSDFKVRSLFTGDFFVDQDMFTTASSIAWVDIVDYLYPIDTDKTKLYVDDVVASGVYFEDIPYGKRLYYDPADDFYSTGGVTYFIHSESSIGEIEEKEFYLLYGYDLHIDEVICWPVHTRIVVRVEASNLTFCSNLVSEAFDFTTVDWPSRNLGCTICPVGFVDLPVGISPQSAAFFYGKTYTVKLQGLKDFAGNLVPDMEYSFTIEDPLR